MQLLLLLKSGSLNSFSRIGSSGETVVLILLYREAWTGRKQLKEVCSLGESQQKTLQHVTRKNLILLIIDQ